MLRSHTNRNNGTIVVLLGRNDATIRHVDDMKDGLKVFFMEQTDGRLNGSWVNRCDHVPIGRSTLPCFYTPQATVPRPDRMFGDALAATSSYLSCTALDWLCMHEHENEHCGVSCVVPRTWTVEQNHGCQSLYQGRDVFRLVVGLYVFVHGGFPCAKSFVWSLTLHHDKRAIGSCLLGSLWCPSLV